MMLQEQQGLRVVFQNVTHAVEGHTTGEKILLLNRVSAVAESGQMTALMGPSGSGKTTLLDVLAGRKNTGTTTGTIRFGDSAPSPALLRRCTGYVEQFDTLIPTLTVFDMLMYTAQLKRALSEPQASKVEVVRKLVKRLGLTSCAHVPIGDPLTKGISGGQAKRTNIGIALVSDPKVLFLDEPTSGLDSYSSNEVVGLIQGLSREGTTVVATIHQPSAKAFAMFDHLLILIKGQTAYSGPQGDTCLQFAAQHWPAGRTITVTDSAAEYLVDLVTEADRNGQAEEVADAYKHSQLKKDNDVTVATYLRSDALRSLVMRDPSKSVFAYAQQLMAEQGDAENDVTEQGSSLRPSTSTDDFWGDGVVVIVAASKAPPLPQIAAAADTRSMDKFTTAVTPWWWALFVLLKYRTLVNYKTLSWILPRTLDKLMFGLVFITLYLRTGGDVSQRQMVNMSASLHMWVALSALSSVSCIPGIMLERPLFYRERFDGLYLPWTYYTAKLMEELTLVTLVSLPVAVAVFYGINYQGQFVLFWLVYMLTLYISTALAYMTAALSPSLDVAMAAMPTYIATLICFAGLIATLDSIPRYWSWYSKINFIRWGWTALMVNHFEAGSIPFSADGSGVLEFFSLGGNKWVSISYLVAFFSVFTTGGYVATAFLRHSKR